MTKDPPDVAKYTSEFVRWVEANFSSFDEFREFYANIIYVNEKKLTKQMWKEKRSEKG